MPAGCPPDPALARYAAGASPPPESAAVAAHLPGCPRCAERVANLDQPPAGGELFAELRGPPPTAPTDPEFLAAVARLLAGPPADPPLPGSGDVLDDYRLVEPLGEGGMGVVYRAVHTRLDRDVALKVIRRGRALDPQAAARFAREMRAAGRVRHPNLVHATDAGVAAGVQYLVMEYVPGTDLARLVRTAGPLPPARACELVRQAATGLHHAHANGLIHRDVKPSNLILGTDGTVRVLDLGLALLPGDPVDETTGAASTPDDGLTSPSQHLGTRHYAAPEQLRDSHRVGPPADVYGLGCTLAYLLTSRTYEPGMPYPPGLPAAVWAKFLAADPADRFPTAAAAADALAPFCPARSPRRSWVRPVVGLAAVLGCAAAVALFNRPYSAAPPVVHPEPDPEVVALPVAPPPRAVPPRGMLPLTTAEALLLQKQWADHLGQPVVMKNTLGMDLALVPPGEFALTDFFSVTLTRPYRIATLEATAGQFARFADETGHQTPAERVKIASGFRTRRPRNQFPHPVGGPVHRLAPGWGQYLPDQPIGYVTWGDVDAFLAWLSKREGRAYRLPTHAEWAWACRAGAATECYWSAKDTAVDADGNGTNSYAWTAASGVDRPQPVGRLRPNNWGLYDMVGNVEELVRDYLVIGHVPAGRAVDPTGPPASDNRVTCGGSYYDALRIPVLTGSAGRNVVYSTQGFRVALDP